MSKPASEEARMRIRIESDGTAPGTSIRNAETGEVIDGIVAATWSCAANEAAIAVLTVELVSVDVTGDGLIPTVENTEDDA